MATDRYSRDLRCPDCGRGGVVEVRENDGWSFVKGSRGRHIRSVPEGFTVINHGEHHHETTIIQCPCGNRLTDAGW